MNDHSRALSRRSACAVLAGAIAWPCLGASAQLAPSHTTKVAHELLLSIFEDPQSACEIGTSCLKLMAGEVNTPEHLMNAIIGAPECDLEVLRTTRH